MTIFKFIFFTLIFTQLGFTAPLNISCDSQGNIIEVNDFKFNKTEVKLPESLVSYDCKKLGTCLLDYEKLQTLNDSTFPVLTELLKTISMEALTDLSERLMTIKEARFRCENIKKRIDSPRDLISLDYPFKGLNSNKKSKNYDLARIKSLIDIALMEGVDPLLVLSILINENPPLVNSQDSSVYGNSYGEIPLDGIAFYDFLGCKITPKESIKMEELKFSKINEYKNLSIKMNEISRSLETKMNAKKATILVDEIIPVLNYVNSRSFNLKTCIEYFDNNLCKDNLNFIKKNIEHYELLIKRDELLVDVPIELKNKLDCFFNEECKGYIKGGSNIKKISLLPIEYKQLDKTLRICNTRDTYINGEPTKMSVASEVTKGSRPGECCVDVSVGKNNSAEFVHENIVKMVAVDFINSKIKSTPLKELSLSIQRYNGLGCLGCTEKIKNFSKSCFDYLDMKKTPLYGARVADIMLNMLMKNPEIMNLIKAKSLNFQKPVPSIFCNKSGVVKIPADFFLEEQKQFLLNNGEERAKLCRSYF